MKYWPLIFLVACAATLPPMPRKSAILRSPKDAASQPVSPVQPRISKIIARPMKVTVAYDLQPVSGYLQQTLETGLSASTNFVNWSVVWLAPYPTATHIVVTLTNQPAACCFYKAFWRDKL